jgi:peroxiredoxin
MRKLSLLLLCAISLFAADAIRRAPSFSLVDDKLEQHDLLDYRGKLVLLNFTQTNCPHCAPVADLLQKMQKKYGDKIAVLAVVNPPDTPETMRNYISGHGITYPVLFDMGQVSFSYVRTTTMNFPRLYMIDANGFIQRDYLYGPLTREIFEGDKLAPEIDKLLTSAPQKK